ncbi:hypothetical protein C2E23DRAFT_741041 [Lenzites betulinus]|nr:hypothetical protein C2E23DRAFT_741041 [Lenzites betulinus]
MGDRAAQIPDRAFHGLHGLPPPAADPSSLKRLILAIDPVHVSSHCSTSDLGLLALRALWNARQLICKLPVVDILMALSSPRGGKDMYGTSKSAQWSKAMAVCRHWRAIIVATPSFWQTIHIGRRSRWLKLALSRAGQIDLRLSFNSTHLPIEALPLLLPQRHRIERMEFMCATASATTDVYLLISAPLPCMKEFIMCSESRGPSDAHTFGFYPENFPALTSLKLTQVNLPWTSLLLSRLRTLDIRGCGVHPSPRCSMNEFLDALKCGDSLEELTLHNFISRVCSRTTLPSDQGPRPSVTLPRLRRLDVADTPSCISRFLSHVNLPVQGKVSLTGWIDSADRDHDFSAVSYACMLPKNLDVLTFLRSTTHAALTTVDGMYKIVCNTPGPLRVSLQLCTRSPRRTHWIRSPDDGLKQLTALLRAAPLSVLHLQCALIYTTRNVLDAALDAFPRLHSLRISSDFFGPDLFPTGLCDSLCASTRPAEGGAVEGPVRCPALGALHLDRVWWEGGALGDVLVECLRERERRGAPRLGLLEIGVCRAQEVDWGDADARLADMLGPWVDDYKFAQVAW